MSIYKQIFLEAFNVVKKHKLLWIFGFFAILFSGSVEGDLYYNFLSNQKNAVYDLMQISSTGIFNKDVLLNLQSTVIGDISSAGVLFFVFFCLILALVLILLLSVGSQMIVINRASEVIKSPKAPSIKLNELIFGGIKNIKTSVFKASLVNILFKLFVFLIFLIITAPIFITAGLPNIMADFMYLIFFVLLMPMTIVASLYVKYVVIGLVVNKFNLGPALANAWKLITRNWLVSIETSFILFLLNIISVFFTLLIISGLAIPLWLLAVAAYQVISYQVYVMMVALSYLILFLVFLLCNSLISTFNISVWTSLYLKLNKNSLDSKIKGFIGGLMR